MTESESFTTFRLRPHWLQYIIDQLPWLVICCCGFLIAGDEELPYRQFVLYAAIGLLDIQDKKVFSKDGDAVWQCSNCGHIVVGKQAPEVCPVCDHPQSYFQVEAVNY